MASRALLIVDIQNDYFPGGKWPLSGQTEAAEAAAAVLAVFRSRGEPVIHIRHEILRPNAPFFVPGTPGAAIHPRVAPQGDEPVIVKNFANAFRETGLKALLADKGMTDLVILGSMTQNCIDSTARAAADLGYGVTVIRDACATLDLTFDGTDVPAAQVQAAYMAALAFGFGKVMTAEAFIAG